MGLEALSRGATDATFVERDREALRCLQKNAAELGLDPQTHVVGGDVFRTLERLHSDHQQYDLIYADPPYNKGHGKQVLDYLDEHTLLTEEGRLFIEESEKLLDPKNLILKGSRNIGNSTLYEYRRAT